MRHLARPMPKGQHIIGYILLGLVLAVVFGFVFGIAVMWLWNVLLPPLFGFATITYWQAVGLVILARLLFGFNGHADAHFRRRQQQACCDETHYNAWWQQEGRQAYDGWMTRRQGGAAADGADAAE